MSFQQGLSGLNAASKTLDIIGNNIANANTTGFKASQAQFADVYAQTLSGAGVQQGIGVRVSASQQFTQGGITVTSNPLDLAVNGQGFFRLSDKGTISYTRNGQFQIDKDGYLTTTQGARVTGYGANGAGVLNTALPVELRIPTSDVPPRATTEVAAGVNLDSRNQVLPAAGFDLMDPRTYHDSTSISLYDSLGNPHTLSTYFVKSAPNEWTVFASIDGTQVGTGALGALNFSTSGSIDTATTPLPFTLSVPVASGAAPMNFDLGFEGTTQFGSNFGVNSMAQDGYAAGRLSGFSVEADGTFVGRYTNGQSSVLAQLVMANFNNPQGLQPLGNNAWAETSDSGTPLVGTPKTGTLGSVQSAAVEDSNVDLTAELVNMITAQRFYQANAQTIKTQDSVLQTLVNLR